MQPKGEKEEQLNPIDLMDAKARLMSAHTKAAEAGIKQKVAAAEDHNRSMDRQSRERIELLKLAKDLTMHPEMASTVESLAEPAKQDLKSGE